MDTSTTTPPKRKERNFEKQHEVERMDMRAAAAPFRLRSVHESRSDKSSKFSRTGT